MLLEIIPVTKRHTKLLSQEEISILQEENKLFQEGKSYWMMKIPVDE